MNKLLKKYRYYCISLFIIIILTITLICLFNYNSKLKVTNNYQDINLFNVDTLIIVSHPTDETLWSSSLLQRDNCLVVCISCGTNKKETTEFVEIMNYTNDSYIILGYPEYKDNSRTNWTPYYQELSTKLNEIINMKKWSIIVTHNSEGEYGNIHHKLINNIVTENTSNKDILYYFNTYHSKSNISNYYDTLIKLDNTSLSNKYKMLSIYKSHDYIVESFSHIIPYEEFISYQEWSALYEETN